MRHVRRKYYVLVVIDTKEVFKKKRQLGKYFQTIFYIA
jgi:hypothetical protein